MAFFTGFWASSVRAEAEKRELMGHVRELPLEEACALMAEKIRTAESWLRRRTYITIIQQRIAETEDLRELEYVFAKLFRYGNLRRDDTEKNLAQWMGQRLHRIDADSVIVEEGMDRKTYYIPRK